MRLVHLVPAAAVLAALGAIAGAAQSDPSRGSQPGLRRRVTRQVAVTSAARACPPALGNGSGPVALIAGATSAATSAPGLGDGGVSRVTGRSS